MSRQNKAKQKAIIAATFTALHKSGQRGPKSTVAKHGKVNTLRELVRRQRMLEALKSEAQTTNSSKPSFGKNAGKKPAGKTGYQGKNPRSASANKPAIKAAA